MAICCRFMSKSFIIVINLLMWAVAAGLIFLGMWLFMEYARYGELIDVQKSHVIPACLLLFSGLVMFLLGLVGCIGVLKEHKCIMGLYFSLLLAVLVGIVGGAAFASFYHQKIEAALRHTMIEGFEKYNSTGTAKDVVDLMQSNLHCCGVNNYTDWETWFHEESSNLTLPESCYSPHSNSTEGILYEQGCYNVVMSQFTKHTWAIYGVIAGCALIVLIGMISACILMRARRSQDFIYRDLGDDDGMHV